MAIIGMDIHRAFAEAIAVEGKTRRRLGRIDLRRDRLEAFATGLKKDDIIVVEATGNAAAVAEVLAPHVGRVVIANPKQVHLIARAKIKTDKIDAAVLAQLYASGFLPEVWIAGRRDTGATPASDAAQSDCPATHAAEEHHSVDSPCPSDPSVSGGEPVRAEG